MDGLRILIVNLMPNKFETELQFEQYFKGDNIDYLYLETHNTTEEKSNYVKNYYLNFQQAKQQKYDALILTGAPLEHLPFQSIYYYEELKSIINWSKEQQHTRLFVCWGAQFALNHYYNVQKLPFEDNNKLFGVFQFDILTQHTLTKSVQSYYSPQSRFTNIRIEDIKKYTDLTIVSAHPKFGPDILISKDNKDVYINGHLEYSSNTLHTEFIRDCNKGLKISPPTNYYNQNDSSNLVYQSWKSFAKTFFEGFNALIKENKANFVHGYSKIKTM